MLEYCLRKAKEIPYERGKQRHYCVITDKRGRILSEGSNDYSCTHPIMKKTSQRIGLFKEYIHSEVLALVRLKTNKKNLIMYVARVDSEGNPKISKPCPVCSVVIKESQQIKTIVYTEEHTLKN